MYLINRTVHVSLNRIYHSIVRYSTFYAIIFLRGVISQSAIHNIAKPLSIVVLELVVAMSLSERINIQFVLVHNSHGSMLTSSTFCPFLCLLKPASNIEALSEVQISSAYLSQRRFYPIYSTMINSNHTVTPFFFSHNSIVCRISSVMFCRLSACKTL